MTKLVLTISGMKMRRFNMSDLDHIEDQDLDITSQEEHAMNQRELLTRTPEEEEHELELQIRAREREDLSDRKKRAAELEILRRISKEEEEPIRVADASDAWPNKTEVVEQTVLPDSCPECGQMKPDCDSKDNGVPQYKCFRCKTRWIPSTGSIFEDEDAEMWGGPRHSQI